jgi:hypothetical protein
MTDGTTLLHQSNAVKKCLRDSVTTGPLPVITQEHNLALATTITELLVVKKEYRGYISPSSTLQKLPE